MSDPLEFTGERFTPECVREIWYEHWHRYAFAARFCAGLNVLDAACGEGYGSNLLARSAASVTGVDLDEAAIAHAARRYTADHLDYLQANALDLPFEDNRFDVVVSFETLEHMAEHDALLTEFRRVLKPEGYLLVSSPDRAIYTDKLQNQNEFHIRELYRQEFESLLSAHFGAWRLWGQKLMFQSALWPMEGAQGSATPLAAQGLEARFSQVSQAQVNSLGLPGHDPVYFLAFCAADESQLPELPPTLDLFDDAEDSVYAHYYHEIRKNMSAGELLQERDAEIERLRSELEQAVKAKPWWRRLMDGD